MGKNLMKTLDLPLNWIDITVSGNGQYAAAGTLDGQIYYSNYYGLRWSLSNVSMINLKSIVTEKTGQFFLALSKVPSNSFPKKKPKSHLNWKRNTIIDCCNRSTNDRSRK